MKANKVKVSVIIPVYNTEKYVREAVESIMTQTMQELEIIIVNDGSTDNSQEILNELANADSRILLYSQSNQGGSIARNIGIKKAKGEYLYFMDSDDILENGALRLCYHKCENEGLDFVIFDADSFNDEHIDDAPILSYKRTKKLKDRVYAGMEIFNEQLINQEFTPSPCLSFIRHTFLDKHNIMFYPSIIHEDQLFTVTLYIYAEKVGRINRSFFHRRIRANSIMTRKFSLKNTQGYLVVTEEVLKLRNKMTNSNHQSIIDLYLSQTLNAAVWQAYKLKLSARLKLASICLFKFKKYVSLKSIGVLLFKSIIHH